MQIERAEVARRDAGFKGSPTTSIESVTGNKQAGIASLEAKNEERVMNHKRKKAQVYFNHVMEKAEMQYRHSMKIASFELRETGSCPPEYVFPPPDSHLEIPPIQNRYVVLQ